MITNLFSVFEPTSSLPGRWNWLSIGFGLALCPLIKLTLPSRYTSLFITLVSFLTKEIGLLLTNAPFLPLLFTALFFLIRASNTLGLMPYIFTATSHLTLTLSLGLPLWCGYFLYGWVQSSVKILAHLVPRGTPRLLIPFIVLIESIRRLIRPLTLSVRLAANIIAGHLLLTLLRRIAHPLSPILGFSVVWRQTLLIMLEIAVAIIQAYVFVILSTLYSREV